MREARTAEATSSLTQGASETAACLSGHADRGPASAVARENCLDTRTSSRAEEHLLNLLSRTHCFDIEGKDGQPEAGDELLPEVARQVADLVETLGAALKCRHQLVVTIQRRTEPAKEGVNLGEDPRRWVWEFVYGAATHGNDS
ncbi:hypothetical protein BHS06_28910 [Myxococcus xanthus]|nr:hypothetical protein BHS06_28910 [Myxococcus xanthus]